MMAKRTRSAPRSPRRRTAARGTATPANAEPQAGVTEPTTRAKVADTAAGNDDAVRIRFYCQGIGDCHLLRFKKSDGFLWMLIDCGIHSSVLGGTDTIRAVVNDIATVTRRLDVIVLTHEHWDHNSGFFLAQATFKQFDVG